MKISKREWYVVAFLVMLIVGCESEKAEVGKEVTLPSGLKYVELAIGDGAVAKEGSRLSVHYTGWLEDGTKFDSSRDGPPFSFTLGAGQVIAGWEIGILGMKVGGKRIHRVNLMTL